MLYKIANNLSSLSTQRELYDILDDDDFTGALVLVKGTESMKASRKEILEKYRNKYWYSQVAKRWTCYVPDATKRNGRRQVSRKNQKDIEDIVFECYSKLENNNEERLRHKRLQEMTFKELFYEYMEHKKEQVKSDTIRRMMVDWKKYYELNEAFISKPFMGITKIDVDDFLNDIAKKYHPKDKCFRNLSGIMKQTFEYAVDADYLDRSPYRTSKVNKKNIVPTRKKPNDKEIFTIEEQALITANMKCSAQKHNTYLIPWIVLLDFETGLRIGEVLALKESDIKDGKIHVQRQLTKKHNIQEIDHIKTIGWRISEYTKSNCGDREVPLTDNAIYYLKHIKDIHKRAGNQYEDYLFYNPDKVITEHAVEAALKRACSAVGIEEKSPHRIRKTYASRLYDRGVAVSDISKLLGHADETTTWRHYIFSVDDTEERDRKVKEALKNQNERSAKQEFESTKVNQKIISFNEIKKSQKAHNLKLFKTH